MSKIGSSVTPNIQNNKNQRNYLVNSQNKMSH